MKSTKAIYYKNLNDINIKEASVFLNNINNFEHIDTVNWPDAFPLKPDTKFIIARSDSAFFIHFVVNEKQIQALYVKDQDPVWQDSCVEFFCQIPCSPTYFNFEFNCIGTCLATERKSRTENVNPLPDTQMVKILRFASLGNSTFEEKKGNFDWTLTVQIPFSILNIDASNLPDMLKANFYKCGDGTSKPHYVSWNPIAVENPDFHRPEFFGELTL
jgi:hypothetical protein